MFLAYSTSAVPIFSGTVVCTTMAPGSAGGFSRNHTLNAIATTTMAPIRIVTGENFELFSASGFCNVSGGILVARAQTPAVSNVLQIVDAPAVQVNAPLASVLALHQHRKPHAKTPRHDLTGPQSRIRIVDLRREADQSIPDSADIVSALPRATHIASRSNADATATLPIPNPDTKIRLDDACARRRSAAMPHPTILPMPALA